MDDEYVTLNNKEVAKGIKGIPKLFTSTYATDSKKLGYEYRPIVKTTFALEYQFFGANPGVSHFINILLYIFLLCFLFHLLLKLVPGYHYLFSLLVVLLFLIHPLHSEVVMSLKNRDALLSFLFALCSLSSYLKYVDGRGFRHVLWGVLFLTLGILSKRDCMTFIAIIPFTLWFFRNAGIKKLVIIGSSFLGTFLMRQLLVSLITGDKGRNTLEWENALFLNSTIFERIPQGFHSFYFYLKMFVVPYPLLSYYGSKQVPIVGWDHPIVWLMIIVSGVMLYLIVQNIRARAIWVYGLVFFIVTVSMFLNVVKPVVGIVGERFAHIPSLGLCIIAVYGVLKFFKIPIDQPKQKLAAVKSSVYFFWGAIVLIFGIMVFTRNSAWKDHYTLYETDVKKAPESAHLHTLFAAASIQKVKENPNMPADQKRKHIANALEHYKESIRIIPDYISSHNNVGMVYYSYYKKPAEAIPYLKRAIELDTNYVEAYFNLATSEAALGNYDLGEKYYLKTIELNPEFVNAYYSLSSVYAQQKKFDKILIINEEAIKKGVRSDIPYVNIGNVYFMQKDTVKAVPYLEKGIELNPNNRQLNSFLADYYKNKGDLNKANHYYDLMGRSSK